MPNKKIDDIPAMLTEGEYVIKKDSAKKTRIQKFRYDE